MLHLGLQEVLPKPLTFGYPIPWLIPIRSIRSGAHRSHNRSVHHRISFRSQAEHFLAVGHDRADRRVTSYWRHRSQPICVVRCVPLLGERGPCTWLSQTGPQIGGFRPVGVRSIC